MKFNPRQQPIRLPSTDVARNDPVTVVAWGKSGAKNAVHNNLQKLDARCMPANECQLYHQNFMSIHRNEFCTLISYGTGTCNVRNRHSRLTFARFHLRYANRSFASQSCPRERIVRYLIIYHARHTQTHKSMFLLNIIYIRSFFIIYQFL